MNIMASPSLPQKQLLEAVTQVRLSFYNICDIHRVASLEVFDPRESEVHGGQGFVTTGFVNFVIVAVETALKRDQLSTCLLLWVEITFSWILRTSTFQYLNRDCNEAIRLSQCLKAYFPVVQGDLGREEAILHAALSVAKVVDNITGPPLTETRKALDIKVKEVVSLELDQKPSEKVLESLKVLKHYLMAAPVKDLKDYGDTVGSLRRAIETFHEQHRTGPNLKAEVKNATLTTR